MYCGEKINYLLSVLNQEFLKRPEALQAVGDALQQNKCTVALLLGMDLSEGLQRDTAIYAPAHPEKAKQVGVLTLLFFWTSGENR